MQAREGTTQIEEKRRKGKEVGCAGEFRWKERMRQQALLKPVALCSLPYWRVWRGKEQRELWGLLRTKQEMGRGGRDGQATGEVQVGRSAGRELWQSLPRCRTCDQGKGDEIRCSRAWALRQPCEVRDGKGELVSKVEKGKVIYGERKGRLRRTRKAWRVVCQQIKKIRNKYSCLCNNIWGGEGGGGGRTRGKRRRQKKRGREKVRLKRRRNGEN
jgi:hypothetical protein